MGEPELPPLYHASVANDLAEVERLLKAGADPNDGESIFHAAEKNHRAVIDVLIQHGCDISGAHAVYGNTPLFFLCGYGDVDAPVPSTRRRGAVA
jgi:ankyrin repeat protein